MGLAWIMQVQHCRRLNPMKIWFQPFVAGPFAGISWRGSAATAISAASAMVPWRYWFVVVFWCSKRNLEQSPVGHSTSILDLFGLLLHIFSIFLLFSDFSLYLLLAFVSACATKVKNLHYLQAPWLWMTGRLHELLRHSIASINPLLLGELCSPFCTDHVVIVVTHNQLGSWLAQVSRWRGFWYVSSGKVIGGSLAQHED